MNKFWFNGWHAFYIHLGKKYSIMYLKRRKLTYKITPVLVDDCVDEIYTCYAHGYNVFGKLEVI